MSSVESPVGQETSGDERAPLLLKVFLTREAGLWNAVSMDFAIVGSGRSADEAVDEMLRMVEDYLRSCFRDGASSLADVRRPVPLGWRVEMEAKAILGRFMRIIRRAGASREFKVFVQRDGRDGLATC